MKRKKKLYQRPMKLYQKGRIMEENVLVKKYGLKNKREIWKTLAKVNYFRKRAMALSRASSEEQEVFFNKLQNVGLKVKSMADVLGLKVEDLLNRRLPTIIVSKGLATTPKQARQMVVHKKILVDGGVVNIPSYIVPTNLESKITVKKVNLKKVVAKVEDNVKEGENN